MGNAVPALIIKLFQTKDLDEPWRADLYTNEGHPVILTIGAGEFHLHGHGATPEQAVTEALRFYFFDRKQ